MPDDQLDRNHRHELQRSRVKNRRPSQFPMEVDVPQDVAGRHPAFETLDAAEMLELEERVIENVTSEIRTDIAIWGVINATLGLIVIAAVVYAIWFRG